MADATLPPSNSPLQNSPPPSSASPSNRLSIAHVLLWTFCCAAILGGYRAVMEWQYAGAQRAEAESQPDGGLEAPSQDDFKTRLLILYAFYSLPLGAQAAGALIWGYRKTTGRGGLPTQPGHWLLVIGGVEAILGLAGQMLAFGISATVGEIADSWWIVWFALLYLPGLLAGAAIYATALYQRAGPTKVWRAVFLCLLVSRVLAGVGLLTLTVAIWGLLSGSMWGIQFVSSYSICSCVEVGIVVLVAVAAFGDPERHSRDFLHWAGVNALIAVAVIQWMQVWGLQFLV